MSERLTFGSLFAGIGGLDLGLERAGLECRWQVEIDPFYREILERHWPEVPKYGDVRELSGSALEAVDVICGGFPCQPVSLAGRRKGEADPRWLWPEFARLVDEVRPRFVVVENVPGLRSLGGAEVIADLASLGYDAEWDSVSAASIGAPHIRERLFIVAYASGGGRNGWTGDIGATGGGEPAHPSWWATEPNVGRVAHGVPSRVDRLRALGNGVVPQVAEHVARRWIIHADQG